MMKVLLILVLFTAGVAFGQKPIELKKKFFGTYEGYVPEFKLDTGKDVVDVDSVLISVDITEDSVLIIIGRNQLMGSYHVLFEGNKYFVLDCRMTGQLAGERIVVYKKGKKISRAGLYPQPSSFLYRKKDSSFSL